MRTLTKKKEHFKKNTLKLSWILFKHYLFSKKSNSFSRLISLICMIGIATGLMSLIVIFGVMEDFGLKMRKRLLFLSPHLVIEEDISASFYENLKRREEVIEINRFLEKDVILKTADGLLTGAISRGSDKESFKNFLQKFKKNQRKSLFLPHLKLGDFGPSDVLLSSDLAEALDAFEGDSLFLFFPEVLLTPLGEWPAYEKIHIKGIIPTQTDQIYPRHLFYKTKSDFKTTITSNKSIYYEKKVELWLKNPYNYLPLYSEIQSKGKKVSSWVENHSELFFALKIEKWAMTLFLSLSVLITSFSIFTLLMLLISQKRKDIGMLMTMGMAPKRIRRLFTQVGIWISVLGVGSGCFLGLLICGFLYFFPLPLLPSRLYYDSFVSTQLNLKFVLSVIFFSFSLSALGSTVATQFYIHLSPTEALLGRKKSF